MPLVLRRERRALFRHQRERLALRRHQCALPVFWQMRLGKSLFAIRWALERMTCSPWHPTRGFKILVVAPRTPLGGWTEELTRERQPFLWLRDLAPRKRDEVIDAGLPRWTIATYETVSRTPKMWSMFDVVILDESTRIKNPRAQLTKKFLRRVVAYHARAILTGSPAPQDDGELFCQMAWVNGGEWMGFRNFYKWRDHHFDRYGFDWVVKPAAKKVIFAAVGKQADCLTRAEAGLGETWLRSRRSDELPPDLRKLYSKIVREWEVPGIEAKHVVAVETWLRRMVGGHLPNQKLACWKYDEVLELARGDLRDAPFVVWFEFKEELHRMATMLHDAKVNFASVYGEVKDRERPRLAFQDPRQGKRVFLATTSVAKYGYDLSRADAEVYFSSPWSWEARSQSEDRIVHPTKKRPLLVVDLVTERTVDEDVMQIVSDRRAGEADFRRAVRENMRTG